MQERVRFLNAFIRSPFKTASITPSSRFLARAMVHGLQLEDASTVIELGPGTGAFTREIETRIAPGTDLACVEIDRDLARTLALTFPRARIVVDTAANLERYFGASVSADCVVSGLPWVLWSSEEQRRLLQPAVRLLRKGGQFATFAYAHAAPLPAGRRFRRLLQELFETVEVSETVWRNLPPAFVYRCRK